MSDHEGEPPTSPAKAEAMDTQVPETSVEDLFEDREEVVNPKSANQEFVAEELDTTRTVTPDHSANEATDQEVDVNMAEYVEDQPGTVTPAMDDSPVQGLASRIEEQDVNMAPAEDAFVQQQMEVHSEEQDTGKNVAPGGLMQEADTQMADVQEQHDQHDQNSLFIPENDPTPPTVLTRQPALAPTQATNVRPLGRTMAGMSTFAKIRTMTMQSQNQKAKAKSSAAAATSLLKPNPKQDALLNKILDGPSTQTGHKPAGDEDSYDRKAAEEYRRQKKHYDDLRRKNGGLSFRQDIEWMRIHSAEEARRKKRKRDQDLAREEMDGGDVELFPLYHQPDEEEGEGEEEPDDGFDVEFDIPPGSRKRQKPDMPRKEVKGMSALEAEVRSMKVALDADGDLPKSKKKGQYNSGDDSLATGRSKSSKAKAKTAKTSKSKSSRKKPAKGLRKTAKQQREFQRAFNQASSLITSNVFIQPEEGAPEQPTFKSKNKQTALKELISSVPQEYLKSARTDMSTLMAATRDFNGHGAARPDGNGLWLVKGMKTSLKAYQLLGSAFMRRREGAVEEPRGGLLADQMGLGKTLMMLANIVNGRPRRGEVKTTLLVASPNLCTQWMQEIETHTNCNLMFMRYGAGNRIDSNRNYQILAQHDIILTTYTEVMKSYPKNEPPIDCQTAEQKICWWKETYKEERGVLHRMQFYRVVLDEAQAIKNHTSRTSIACRALMAHHRWALSGTPVLNGLAELYSYFKFLDVPHTGSFKIFKHNYCDPKNPDSTERLLSRLAQFMIRRTHSDQMFGAPILKLPKPDQATFWCDFNPIERNIYDIVRQRFAKSINMWSKKGQLEKSYSNALVMLLRLRQLTAHVLMLQFVLRDLLEREDIERIRQVIRDNAADDENQETILAVRKQLDDLEREEKKRTEAEARGKAKGKDAQASEESSPAAEDVFDEAQNEEPEDDDSNQRQKQSVSGEAFGKTYEIKPYINALTTGESWEKAKKHAQCCRCLNRPVEPWFTSCNHIYCFDCLQEAALEAAETGQEHAPCSKCGQIYRYCQPCDPDGELDDSQRNPYEAPETRSKSKSKKGKGRCRTDREDIKDDWLSLGGDGVLPSAKTIAIKAQIINWFRENPNVKIIIYTQFLAMIRILAKVCQEEGWAAEQYHGKLSFTARDKAIRTFADNSNVRIMLASLRCGGLGLNLTMASRVIVIDPWWNSAAEQQAFCRVFRIGQKETTFMMRFCVKNTVDERLIDMQERKQEEINEVMEDDGSRVKKLSIKDLMRLFGNISEDNEGKPFILVDNPDPRGGFKADRDDEGYADEY